VGDPTKVRRARWWGRITRADKGALAFFVLVPTVLFAGPALLGHPAIAQDNFIQNYPLRVLSGSQIASGHLPLLNPLANAGAPLLGGMNAGSFYPASLLFVFLPGLVAWVINLVLVYVTAALGLYALARWLGIGALAALLAALTYAYAGSMMGQLVHLGVIEGYALLPWLVLVELWAARRLLAPHHFGEARRARAWLGAALALAAVWALACLSGEPRAIVEVELVGIVVVVVELVRSWTTSGTRWRSRGAYLLCNIAGGALGAGLALAQLLPGWSFITQSERAGITYSFFTQGSLAVRWSALLLNQDLFGGNGALGSPGYFGNGTVLGAPGYAPANNLSEITGYVGLIALVAVFAFVAQLLRRRRTRADGHFVVFLVLVVVGLLAAWGGFTPLGHVLHDLPLFGETRIQSRNVVVCDLGAAVLAGWFLDRVFAGRFAEASLAGVRRLIALLPVLATVVLTAAVMADPVTVDRFFGVAISHAETTAQRGTLGLSLVIALAVGFALTVVVGERARRRWLVALFVVDLLAFNLYADVGFATGSTTTLPTRASAVAVLGDTGRYAIVDAGQVDFGEFESLGVPNLNVFSGLPSVEGYGSLVSAQYAAATGTHELVTLNACNLIKGVFAPLRLDTLVVSQSSLTYAPGHANLEPLCAPPTPLSSVTRYFGANLLVDSLTLHVTGATPHGSLLVQYLTGDGAPDRAPVRVAWAPVVRLSGVPAAAAGFTVRSAREFALTSTTVRYLGSTRTQSLVLAGAYQEALGSAQWHLVATNADYAVFRATSVPPADWLSGDTRGSAVTASSSDSWGDETVTVTAAHAVTLIRSEEWISGWRATLVSPRGETRSATVHRDGLVQSILVPPGRWTIAFAYHAPYITLGLIGSLASLFVFIVALVVLLVRPRWLGRVAP
jgi:hypothetical protein